MACSLAAADDAVGQYGSIVMGDATAGINLAQGWMRRRRPTGEETIREELTWTGELPIVGTGGIRLNGFVLNLSTVAVIHTLAAYLVEEIPDD